MLTHNPLLMTDGYKTCHHRIYPKGTTLVYSNYTLRSTRLMPEQAKDIVVFGVQYMAKYIHELYDENFFKRPKDEVCGEAKAYLSNYLGSDYDVSHFEALHDLGVLPICIKALPEGTVVGERIPIMTIYNTKPDFFWVTNFLETLISSLIWKPVHSASLAFAFKKILTKGAKETDANSLDFVNFQAHDFSFRGMQHPESAVSSGMGFLTSFSGSDSIPCLKAMSHYYNSENVAFSVPASEHSVMTAYGKENEIDGFRRILKQFPTGIVSVVSDSFDLWKVVTEYVTEMKEEITSREGRLVIRPDSGDPVDIICGKNTNPHFIKMPQRENEPYVKGVVECLWDVFGGTTNAQGFKVLDPHIGVIYGDSITLERAQQICDRLKEKGFASTNVVLGVGSYSMGYATRDQQGGAVKSTYCIVDGQEREIFKDPVTDSGTKKSAKGLLTVWKDENGNHILKDQVTWDEEVSGELRPVYMNGRFLLETTLAEVRENIDLCV